MQRDIRYVVFAYIAIGLAAAVTLAKLFGAIFYFLNIPDPAIIGSNLSGSDLAGAVIAGAAGIYAFKNTRAREFSVDVVSELRKVTWPSRKETQTATVVVIVTTLVVALILFVFDSAWSELTGIIYTRK